MKFNQSIKKGVEFAEVVAMKIMRECALIHVTRDSVL
jgi:hypothetical protein